ncbi:DUF2281 domain-containing protein [Roseofilum acuticapitatum]
MNLREQAINNIENLPEELVHEVNNFIEFLIIKSQDKEMKMLSYEYCYF